jgi:hypothetical protein
MSEWLEASCVHYSCEECCEKCGVAIIKDNISSRNKMFDKHYIILSGLLSCSGFGWD